MQVELDAGAGICYTRPMQFEVLGPIIDIETIAVGTALREIARLRRVYGPGRWRKRKGVATIRLLDGTVHTAELHCMRQRDWAEKSSKSDGYGSDMTSDLSDCRFVVCIRNDDYPASLEVRKLYLVVPEATPTVDHYLRIIDESGEDYLYPDDYFMPIDLPQPIRAALQLAA